MKKLILLLLLNLLITSCTVQKNFKKYYFPISSTKETKVYKYIDRLDHSNIEYWKVTTNPKTGVILTECFDTLGELIYLIEGEITKKGIELIRFSSNEKKVDANMTTLIDKDIYKWKNGEEYKYSVKYESIRGEEILERKHTNIGFKKINVNGIEYDVVEIVGYWSIKSLELDEIYDCYEFTYYAKNIGMVKDIKSCHHGDIELELTEILTEEEFDKQFEDEFY